MDIVNGKTGIAVDCFLECREAVNRKLESLRPFSAAPTLENAFELALFPGGKRLRPIMALACGELFGKRTDALLTVAVAVELLHTASLVFDDLPVMDNADARRGKPTLHKLYTPHLAVLCGHGMVSQALHLPTQSELSDSACRKIIAELSSCIGPHGMAAGQADDLDGTVIDNDYDALLVAEWKTGHLFRAAAYCGAVAGGAPDKAALLLAECGLHLGIAYQIADDLQDHETEDNPRRSVNVALLLGRDGAKQAFHKEISQARKLAGKAAADGAIMDFVEIMESYV